MIVTVKAWLHAEVNYKGETEYKLHAFQTPLHARDIPIREMSFDVIVEEKVDDKARETGLKQELAQLKGRVEQLKCQLGEA